MAASAPKSRRKSAKPRGRVRRGVGLAGVSMVATTGLLSAYVGYPGLRRASAVTNCTVSNNGDTATGAPGVSGQLRYCLYAVDGDGGTITFDSSIGTISLVDNLPGITLSSSLTITGAGRTDTIIDGVGANEGFDFTGADVSLSSLTITNTYEDGTSGDAIRMRSSNTVTLTSVNITDNASDYAAIYSGGDVNASASTFSGNQADDDSGAAIHAKGSVTVLNSTFSNNTADGDGGAIYSYDGTIDVTDSTFTSNDAGGSGGALYANANTTGAVVITDSTFTSNTSIKDGGAVKTRQNGATITVSGSTFTNNHAYYAGDGFRSFGGAIFSYGNLTVDSSTFTGNKAGVTGDSGGGGGALYVKYGVLNVTDSTFENNSALYSGGAVMTYANHTQTVSGSTFVGNSAGLTGGAIYAYYSSLDIENSTFTGNYAGNEGSAIYTYYGDATVDFCTITANTAGSVGASAVYDFDYGTTLTISNSILYNNVDSNGDAYDVRADNDLNLTYSLLTSASSFSAGGTDTTSNLLYGDPLLGSLADNGGPTRTMLPASASPVIGMANASGAPSFDQRGFTRTTNGLADMGSVEVGGIAPEPDLSQVPPSWFQAQQRQEQTAVCPPDMFGSWAEWPNGGTGGWTCEWVTWWDVNKGSKGGWVTTPGFNPGLRATD